MLLRASPPCSQAISAFRVQNVETTERSQAMQNMKDSLDGYWMAKTTLG